MTRIFVVVWALALTGCGGNYTTIFVSCWFFCLLFVCCLFVLFLLFVRYLFDRNLIGSFKTEIGRLSRLSDSAATRP